MRFEYLEFSGIGPFRQTHRIDFSQINDEGIFLIEGPTGSGKSTIIDAVSFALFGSVAGNESSKYRLRSSHAEDSEESWVDFVFTISSGTYRIRRTPEYSRKAKRGEGMTTRKPTVALWRISPTQVSERNWENGEAIATKAREVGIELGKLFPLSREQFLQTVVLPQGQFAQFLKLKSAEREAILATIFNTRDYQEFTKALVEHGKEKLSDVNTAKVKFEQRAQDFLKLESLSATFVERAPEALDSLCSFTIPNEISAITSFTNSLAEELNQIKEYTTEEEKLVAIAATELKKSQEQYHDVVDKQQRQEKYLKLQEELKNLEKIGTDIEAEKEKLTKHSAAIEVISHLGKAKVTAETAATAYQTLSIKDPEINTKALELPTTFELEEWDSEKLEKTWRKLQQQQQSLAARVEDLKQKVAQIKEVQSLKAQAQNITNELEQLHTQNKELEKSEAELKENIQSQNNLEIELQKTQKDLQDAVAQKAELDKTQKEFSDLEKLEAQTAQQLAKAEAAEAAFATKRNELDSAFSLWIGAAPAMLAQKLQEDEPCPVCGASTHPAPATFDEDVHIDEEQIFAIKAAHDDLLQKFQIEHQRLQEFQSQIESSEIRKKYPSHADLTKVISENKTQTKSLQEALEKLNTSLEKLKTTQVSLEKQAFTFQENKQKLARLEGNLESLKQRIFEQEKTLPTEEDSSLLTAELTAKIEESEKMTNVSEEFRIFEQETYRAIEAQENSTKALQNSPFTDYEQAKSSALPDSVATQLQDKIANYTEESISLKAQLTALDISDLDLTANYDPAPLNARVNEAEETHRNTVEKAARAAKNYENALQLTIEAQKYGKQWEELAVSGGVILRLVDLATASAATDSRVPLNIWILTQRFEQIVERANQHLQQISAGRYELIRSAEEGRIKKTGLGLSIIDRDGSAQGDVIRPTTSLSGGETFYTSLALALALAEVVQEENGGIHINTLIIDEGFGSLSDSVLDEVMNSLQGLRDAGRTVGVVSHVAELKSRITSRITVRKLERGQSTLSLN